MKNITLVLITIILIHTLIIIIEEGSLNSLPLVFLLITLLLLSYKVKKKYETT